MTFNNSQLSFQHFCRLMNCVNCDRKFFKCFNLLNRINLFMFLIINEMLFSYLVLIKKKLNYSQLKADEI